MKVLSPKLHGYLDYLVVLIFAMAPCALGFSTVPMVISYSLAGIHLALTLLTNFPLGVIKVIPLKIHGLIELIVGPCLVALPFVLKLTGEPAAEYFYIVTGIVIFLVWLLTDYGRK
jgi:hypothetical protein